MAKKVTGYIKLQIPAAKATPAPPVGPALGQKGVNIVQFTKEFNARTADQAGMIIPVIITVYADRSFTFVCKTPPAAILIKKACNIQTASAAPNKTKVATLSKADLQKIAETKMPDLNAASLEAAMSMIAGTARSMGVMHRDAPCYRLGSVCISQIIIADSRLSHSSVHRHQTHDRKLTLNVGRNQLVAGKLGSE